MTTTGTTGCYDEALERLHRTGPEFEGWLSNHGPMVIEVLSRRGHGREVHRWTDRYVRRLDEVPRGVAPITRASWRPPLGDPTRTGDWITFFAREVEDAPWTEVLATWWPRLLPGIGAGATHGVIRTGHAVRGLREVDSAPRVSELAHALAYWAARWQPLPVVRGTGRARATMLVHAATAPNAVAAALPPLPESAWCDSFDAAWSATAAVLAAYRPAANRPVVLVATTAQDELARAVDHGGEHVIKLADAALSSHERTGSPHALAAARIAVDLDA